MTAGARRTAEPSAGAAVQREWLRRVEAEYRSAAITAQLSHALIQLGAPPALIRDGLRIVRDELTHAELSHKVYRRAGGGDPPALAQEELDFGRSAAPLDHDVTRVAVQVYCLGETAAVRLFHRMRVRASVPVARAALDRILRDEVRHRDFGWALLGWLMESPNAPSLRALVERSLPAMLAGLLQSYGGTAPSGAVTDETAFASASRAWGLIPVGEYRAAIALCMKRDLAPRFMQLGFRADRPAP